MGYDTRQGYQPQPRYGGPPPDETRDDPPAWHDAATAEPRATAGPSDLDAAEPEPVSPQADAVTPVDTGASVITVGSAPVEAPDEAVTVWPEDAVHDFQQRWREVQLRFVDDPRAAADEAQHLITEALDRFAEAVTDRKGQLDGWRDTDGADTERMRTVVRRYRKLLDRLLEV
jgi:hypothetical protein